MRRGAMGVLWQGRLCGGEGLLIGDSSKNSALAFVLFTRAGEPVATSKPRLGTCAVARASEQEELVGVVIHEDCKRDTRLGDRSCQDERVADVVEELADANAHVQSVNA